MIAGNFTLWFKSQSGINWLASKALPELGTALPQLVLFIFPQVYPHPMIPLIINSHQTPSNRVWTGEGTSRDVQVTPFCVGAGVEKVVVGDGLGLDTGFAQVATCMELGRILHSIQVIMDSTLIIFSHL